MIALKLKCDEGERMKKRKIDFFSFFSKTNEERVKIWWEVNTGEDTIESVYFCNGKCFIIATPKSKTKERKKVIHEQMRMPRLFSFWRENKIRLLNGKTKIIPIEKHLYLFLLRQKKR